MGDSNTYANQPAVLVGGAAHPEPRDENPTFPAIKDA